MNDAVLRDAMDAVLLWGPERMTPEIDRLREKHPGHSDSYLQAALLEAHRVLSEAEELAAGIKTGEIRDAHRRISEGRPWLSDEQVGRAVQQGLYFHWRDTGL